MRDNELETQLRMLTLQMESWKKLHDLITYGLDKAKPIISAEQERQFTEIRGYLLQETEHVLTELNLLSELSGKAMNVLQRCVSIRGVRELSNEEVRRLEVGMERRFHEARRCAGPIEIAAQGFSRARRRLPTISAAFCSGQPDFLSARGLDSSMLSPRIV